MRVRNDNYDSVSEINLIDAQLPVLQKRTAPRPGFNDSFEKEIECLWFESRRLGWSYNEFAIHLLELLAVLSLRDKLKLPPSSPNKA
jgi:hypothetical protein